MKHHDGNELVNIGCGSDIAIADLARLVADVVGFSGALEFDTSKPDGTPRKLLDVSRLSKQGWQARIPLVEGIRETYRWFSESAPQNKG
jgi:GDP-L-fucose synthase